MENKEEIMKKIETLMNELDPKNSDKVHAFVIADGEVEVFTADSYTEVAIEIM